MENYAAYQGSIGETDFTVRILTAKRFSTYHETMGLALECATDQRGCSAYVFYRDVVELAADGVELTADGDASESKLLGHVLAHEIGHLLLGPNAHPPMGVMRAHWNHQDLQRIDSAGLCFTDQQAQRLRSEVQSRINLKRRAEISEGVPKPSQIAAPARR